MSNSQQRQVRPIFEVGTRAPPRPMNGRATRRAAHARRSSKSGRPPGPDPAGRRRGMAARRSRAPLAPAAAAPVGTTRRPPGPAESPDAWASTRAHTALATQTARRRSDYLAGEKDEIGRQIGGNERELFVSCAPAEAMQQQFEHLQPDFIAVHDIATASSRKLLAGIAAASGRAVQKLVIRRQGYGTPLATLEFVELPTPDNQLAAPLHHRGRCRHGGAPRARQDAAGLQPARRGDGRRAAGPRHRGRAQAAARRHPGRPVAEPQPAAAAARLGEHAGHPRHRPRPRHRRRRANDAAGGPPRRRLGLHHRHLEPPARADANRRPRGARARRASGRRPTRPQGRAAPMAVSFRRHLADRRPRAPRSR